MPATAAVKTAVKTQTLRELADGDPRELARAVAVMRPADLAEELDRLPPESAARVLAALPFDLAVQLFDEPEFTHRRRAFECLPVGEAVPLLEAMSTDQLADLLRKVKEPERGRLLAAVKPATREALTLLLA